MDFLLPYMLFGLSFIGLAFLKIENIVDCRIRFQSKKNSEGYDIKLLNPLKRC
jgi:hypothetical protein